MGGCPSKLVAVNLRPTTPLQILTQQRPASDSGLPSRFNFRDKLEATRPRVHQVVASQH